MLEFTEAHAEPKTNGRKLFSWKNPNIKECEYSVSNPLARSILTGSDLNGVSHIITSINVGTLGKMKLSKARNIVFGACLNSPDVIRQTGQPCVPVRGIPVRPYILDLRYPFSKTARITVNPYQDLRSGTPIPKMDLGYLLWGVSRVYRKIYQEKERWGVWQDYNLCDLWFVEIFFKDGLARVDVTSMPET